MPQFSDVHLAADQTAQSLVFDKRLASDLIAQWPKDKPFDASVILADHPELRQHKSVVLDLAYEEYCRRTSRGEILSAHEFAARFRDIQRSLLCLIDVHQLLHENPQLMEDSTELVWPKVGEKFQDLELTANLGRGAFARVFLARESGIGGRLVVSKLSKTGGREAEFLGRLEHPHIVPIFSVKHDEQSGLSAICMPYLGRATLLDLIDGIAARNNLPASASQLRLIIQSFDVTPPSASQHRKPIRSAWQRTSLDALIDLGIQLAEGLEFAHEQNVCHGDIKPSNVLITPQGQAMLMDFNLSFQTQGDDKALGGTLPYMAPEQLRRIVDREAGQSPASNERTDIYALGVVMYELLAGRYPFGSIPVDEPKHQAATNLLRRQEHGFRPLREVNPNIDRHLAGCIEKCLTYNAEDRWRTATELRSALEYANSLRQRSRRWVRRHRKTVLAAACAASLAVSASAYSMLTREPLEVRLYRAGTEALSTQNYDVAIGSFTELAALTPESPEVLFSLGRAYQGKRQFKDALEYFSDCWNIDPDHRPSQACIAQCQAELLRDQKKLSQQE
ncbi:MAG TPA: protein kinase, partial [Planctomycetaceae bacterium]|nr:protein kinase [Planctomycetaceae bacterium]